MASLGRRIWQRLRRWYTAAMAEDEDYVDEHWSFTDEYPYYVDPPPREELKLDLSEPIELGPGLLRQLEWKRLEELVAGWYRAGGVDVQTAHTGVIGGPNLYVYGAGDHRPRACVVCSPLLETTLMARRVRELVAAMAADDVAAGVFIAAGPIAPEVRAQAGSANIEWIDGPAFVALFGGLPVEERDRILRQATRGDYRSPTCPSCQVKMVLLETEPKPFWRCPNFPRCQRKMTARSMS